MQWKDHSNWNEPGGKLSGVETKWENLFFAAKLFIMLLLCYDRRIEKKGHTQLHSSFLFLFVCLFLFHVMCGFFGQLSDPWNQKIDLVLCYSNAIYTVLFFPYLNLSLSLCVCVVIEFLCFFLLLLFIALCS